MKALLFAALAILTSVRASPQALPPITVWVPGAYAASPGNYLQTVPFVTPEETTTVRYQQVFAAHEFDEIPQGGFVTALTFRRRAGAGRFAGTSSGFQVNMSTSPNQPDSLSPVFAENVGGDDRTVWGARPLSFGWPPPTGSDMRTISLDTPFFYDPRGGNLLLDMRNFTGNDWFWDAFYTGGGDAVYAIGDAVSCVYAVDVNALSGVVSSEGYIVGFEVQAVPEPGTICLFMAGCVFWGVLTRRLPGI